MKPVAAALLANISILCFAQSSANSIVLPWGEPNQGLRMSLLLHNPDGSTPEFYIAFENVGERDTVLFLGQMYSNGATLLPEAIRLVVTTLPQKDAPPIAKLLAPLVGAGF